jgi:hypothetical protein
MDRGGKGCVALHRVAIPKAEGMWLARKGSTWLQ